MMVNQPGPKLKTEFLFPSAIWLTSFFLNTGIHPFLLVMNINAVLKGDHYVRLNNILL